jgi:hypothetical protein
VVAVVVVKRQEEAGILVSEVLFETKTLYPQV